MDLSTRYMGFRLPHPLMVGASPLTTDLDRVRRMVDAGASAIVMHSLFEEQILREEMATRAAIDEPAESFGEALSYFPSPADFKLGADEYLQQLRKIKAAVGVPVIASLNGTTSGGWLRYARMMTEAGADALELNIYFLPTDQARSGASLDQHTLDLVREVKRLISIPLAVKLSPFYSSLPNFAAQLDAVGVNALVLFNRFYQPDIDIEALEVRRSLELSTSVDLRLRLRFLAILSGKVKASLAVTGGVHTAEDAIRAIMAGAHGVQMVSALLENGEHRLREIREGLAAWGERHGYESLEQMRGSMNLARCPDPGAFERANYMHILQSWRR